MGALVGATVALVGVTAANNTKRVLPSRWYVYSFWHSMCFTTYAFQVLPRLRKLHHHRFFK